jgi:ketosteroid isomerase-like protein
VIRTRLGEQTLTERETIVFRRDGDRWTAVHEHLSPQPGPAAVPEPLETGGTATA